MKNFFILITVVSLVVFSGCIDKQDNSTTPAVVAGDIIETTVGDSFTIKLDSNPTTGYSWHIAGTLPDMLVLIDNNYIQAETRGNLVGSGGVENWTFKAVKKGTTILTFEYARPWEVDIPAIKEQIFTIRAK